MMASIETDMASLLADVPFVQLGILFGSAAEGQMRTDSDLDLAVMGKQLLVAAEKMALIEKIIRRPGVLLT